MFKKTCDLLNDIKWYVRKNNDNLDVIRKNTTGFNDMINIIESQQHTIETLTNALQNKYEHGLFVFTDDYQQPIVIRNGENITGRSIKYFNVSWSPEDGIRMKWEDVDYVCTIQ